MQMPFFQNLSSFQFHPDQKSGTKIPAFYLKQKALVLQEVLALAVSLIQIRFPTLIHFLSQTHFPTLIHFLSQSLMAFQIHFLIHFLFQSLALIRLL